MIGLQLLRERLVRFGTDYRLGRWRMTWLRVETSRRRDDIERSLWSLISYAYENMFSLDTSTRTNHMQDRLTALITFYVEVY
eukprot:scaffold215793_cov22-Prasinocladus_malaysianus.AAC.1